MMSLWITYRKEVIHRCGENGESLGIGIVYLWTPHVENFQKTTRIDDEGKTSDNKQ